MGRTRPSRSFRPVVLVASSPGPRSAGEALLWFELNTLPENRIPAWVSSLSPGEKTLRLLLKMAGHLHGGNQPARALRVVEACREVARKKGLRGVEADCLTKIGRVLCSLGEGEKSAEALEEARALHQKLGDKAGEAWDLMEMGQIWIARKDASAAVQAFQRALGLAREAGDKEAVANSLWRLGEGLACLRRDPEAMEAYREALALYRELGDRAEEARCLRGMADIHWVNDRSTEAGNLYRQALRVDRGWNPEGAANDLMGLGEIAVEKGNLSKALDRFGEAMELYHTTGCRPGEAQALSRAGMVLFEMKEFEKTLGALRRAAPLYLELGDARNEALTYAVMGAVYLAQGNERQADAMGERAERLHPGVMEELGKQTGWRGRGPSPEEGGAPLYG